MLSKFFLSSGEGIMVFDGGASVVAMNPRAEEMFGYKESELVGEKVERLIPQQHRKKHEQSRNGYMKRPAVRSMGAGLDLWGLRQDGSTFPIEISLSYLHNEDDLLVVAFITDISVRKKQEEILNVQRAELEEYAQQLEAKVKDRTREWEQLNLGLQSQIQERKVAEAQLKKSLEELKRAEKEILKALEKERELSELKSRFVSMASHEFRTPLTTIASSASLINKYPETSQQAQREKHTDRILNSVKNLTAILNDFLSLEKLESGGVTVSEGVVALADLLDEVTQEISLVMKKGQSIHCPTEGLPKINTDSHLLKNLLINLLSNAIKYSPEDAPIKVLCEEKPGSVKISVVDQGIGIPEKEQTNLFDRFFRAANATNIQGTGLGLHIVKKYADLLGGSIFFESEEGKGSTFSIELPKSL